MKNIISKTNRKELFWFLLAPVSFISIFYLSIIIESVVGEPNHITYLNKFIVFIVLILISMFSIYVFNTTRNVCNKNNSIILTAIFVTLEVLYIISFIHPISQGIFFLEVFILSLIINIILTYIISLFIKHS